MSNLEYELAYVKIFLQQLIILHMYRSKVQFLGANIMVKVNNYNYNFCGVQVAQYYQVLTE